MAQTHHCFIRNWTHYVRITIYMGIIMGCWFSLESCPHRYTFNCILVVSGFDNKSILMITMGRRHAAKKCRFYHLHSALSNWLIQFNCKWRARNKRIERSGRVHRLHTEHKQCFVLNEYCFYHACSCILARESIKSGLNGIAHVYKSTTNKNDIPPRQENKRIWPGIRTNTENANGQRVK